MVVRWGGRAEASPRLRRSGYGEPAPLGSVREGARGGHLVEATEPAAVWDEGDEEEAVTRGRRSEGHVDSAFRRLRNEPLHVLARRDAHTPHSQVLRTSARVAPRDACIACVSGVLV